MHNQAKTHPPTFTVFTVHERKRTVRKQGMNEIGLSKKHKNCAERSHAYMTTKIKAGCKDIWNAYMVKGAAFSEHDIPICPTTATTVPKEIITYSEAIAILNKHKGEENFSSDSYVCFYQHDVGFDGKRGIWAYPKKAYGVLKHFAGIIAPDFSTYQDFPDPLKRWNYYRMNAFGYWYGRLCHKSVIVNCRADFSSDYEYCFDGIRDGESMVAIGTVASGLREKRNRKVFIDGIINFIQLKRPESLIVYGFLPDEIRKAISDMDVAVHAYEARTNKDLRRWRDEQAK